MGVFKQFLAEQVHAKGLTVELHLHAEHPPVIKIHHHGAVLDEKQYHDEEGDHIDGALYKDLGKFKPSKLDHHTITHEFHAHLAKHGYYSHSPAHPMVLSPHEQKFKSEFKRRVSKSGRVKHETIHRDGGVGGKQMGTMGRHVALWSTKGATRIYHDDKTPIPDASKDHHVIINNDSKTKHKASGEHNRWFLRAGEIRKIPHTGLQSPTKHGVKQFGYDLHGYTKSKHAFVGGPKRDVKEFDRKHRKAGTAGTGKHKEVMDWIAKEHPHLLPNHHED